LQFTPEELAAGASARGGAGGKPGKERTRGVEGRATTWAGKEDATPNRKQKIATETEAPRRMT
jgi:hypothetical protein